VTGDCLPFALCGVSKRWRAADEPILDEVELIVEPGTCVEVQAANGTGKTTLLRIAAGLIRPERGRIRLGSLDVEGDRAEFQRRIGFLSATSAGLYGRLTVRDHLRLWSRLAMLPPAVAARCRKRVIDAVALW
jgi:ABC-type multidrug transport system ATPase subunit